MPLPIPYVVNSADRTVGAEGSRGGVLIRCLPWSNIDDAFLSRWCIVPTFKRDTSNTCCTRDERTRNALKQHSRSEVKRGKKNRMNEGGSKQDAVLLTEFSETPPFPIYGRAMDVSRFPPSSSLGASQPKPGCVLSSLVTGPGPKRV